MQKLHVLPQNEKNRANPTKTLLLSCRANCRKGVHHENFAQHSVGFATAGQKNLHAPKRIGQMCVICFRRGCPAVPRDEGIQPVCTPANCLICPSRLNLNCKSHIHRLFFRKSLLKVVQKNCCCLSSKYAVKRKVLCQVR